jgi:hypothetical protein
LLLVVEEAGVAIQVAVVELEDLDLALVML